MKKRYLILIAAIIALLALLLWLWKTPSQPAGQNSSASSEKNIPTPASGTPGSATTTSNATTTVPTAPPSQPMSKGEKIALILNQLNTKNIEFYGKVIDQDRHPLADVSVYATAIYHSAVSEGENKTETKTDAQGLFSFHDMKGRTLGIGLDKAGYEYGGDKGPFQYTDLVSKEEHFHPDANSPVIFVMYKLRGAEPMIHGEKYFKLPHDGTPIRIDLLTGKQVENGGDILIAMKHDVWPNGIIPVQRKFNWSANIAPINGGVVESTQRLMYLAPEDGYIPALTFNYNSDTPGWTSGVDESFYLKTRNNIYSRVSIQLRAVAKVPSRTGISVEWWLNPSGSRNLEYDSKDEIPLGK
ncbi:MAG TPA: hypothetical protein VK717_02695 [Opitutaceae bacterium]|jgi:hypothetical protein|nr:hypothetical protein [Opitutaceae bacterium]